MEQTAERGGEKGRGAGAAPAHALRLTGHDLRLRDRRTARPRAGVSARQAVLLVRGKEGAPLREGRKGCLHLETLNLALFPAL